MWQRAELKNRAKQELKISYWLSFAVCLVASIIAGGAGGASGSGNSANAANMFGPYTAEHLEGPVGTVSLSPTVVVVFFFLFLTTCAIMIFLYNPVEAGKKSFFIRAPYGDRRFGHLFSAFASGRYLSIVKTMFLTNLVIGLWSLLLVIPGFVKLYQYRMVPYLISEDPSLSARQAMALSRNMTKGEKWRMFVLDLSFIGWFLLGSIPFGIGLLFLNPYYEATCAQLYFALKPKVITPANGVQPQA